MNQDCIDHTSKQHSHTLSDDYVPGVHNLCIGIWDEGRDYYFYSHFQLIQFYEHQLYSAYNEIIEKQFVLIRIGIL